MLIFGEVGESWPLMQGFGIGGYPSQNEMTLLMMVKSLTTSEKM